MSLKPGRVALVTGASRGLGRAIALRLAREGASIAVNYLEDPEGVNRQEAEAVASEVTAGGGKAIPVAANVSDAAQVETMARTIAGALGPVSILVNNAGILRDMTLKRMGEEDWQAVLDVNLTGAFRCVRAVLEGMREAGWGRVVNLSSVVGLTGGLGQTNYAASKAGLIGFTKSLAREVGRRGITANAVAPGFIRTGMLYTIPEEARTKILEQIPLNAWGEPEDVAHAVAFLASEESRYITGQVIGVNGGYYM
ncbi:MAG: 3-oxoacyl-[acyl-carrier-protein] reductase [Candidatus Latescibacteria bacterium]|nr:3-oxoacyl-[acyl-carrier-protein] reductase [Candidatus Latescibacterota bacterium]